MSAPTIDCTVEAEQVVIGALVQAAPDLQVAALAEMRDDDITDRWCRFTLTTIRQMVAENVPVDAVTVHQFVVRHGLLDGGTVRGSFAIRLADWTTPTAVPTPGNLPWYVAGVVEQASRRRINEAAENVVRVAADGSVSDVSTVVGVEMTAIAAALGRLRGVSANA